MVTGEFGNAGIRHVRMRGGLGLPRGLLGPATEENTVVAQIPGSQRIRSAGAGPDGGNIELYTP